MGVPIGVWMETMKRHPAKYRFRGLDGWHTDVREACVADEQFMDRYMSGQREGEVEELASQLGAKAPSAGQEDDCLVEAYAMFLRHRFWHRWNEQENIKMAPARKVIELLEDDADLRHEWAAAYYEPQFAWDDIRGDDPEYYLKDHPPEAMWSHAYEQGVELEDVVFVCPGCHREPIREKDLDQEPLRFYCGLCGAEACPDEGETLESWASAVGAKLWPFKQLEEECA